MYIRMGSKNEHVGGISTHIHLDGIVMYSRQSVDDYIKKIEAMRDALWPPDVEPVLEKEPE